VAGPQYGAAAKPSTVTRTPSEIEARNRDACAAWHCLHDATTERLCAMAGIPEASVKSYGQLTLRERTALVVALREPDVRELVGDEIRWGLEQAADLPEEYASVAP
jgi:hypothetical protein